MTQNNTQIPSRSGVFSKPRRRPSDEDERPPYPVWFTVPLRGVLAAFEIAVAAYIGWYNGNVPYDRSGGDISVAMAGIVFAIILDAFTAILTLLGKCKSGSSLFTGFADLAPAIICIVGLFRFASREVRYTYIYLMGRDPWRRVRNTVFILILVVSIVHFACLIMDCVGCFISYRRTRKAARQSAGA